MDNNLKPNLHCLLFAQNHWVSQCLFFIDLNQHKSVLVQEMTKQRMGMVAMCSKAYMGTKIAMYR